MPPGSDASEDKVWERVEQCIELADSSKEFGQHPETADRIRDIARNTCPAEVTFDRNTVGVQAAKAIGEALKLNTTLAKLK